MVNDLVEEFVVFNVSQVHFIVVDFFVLFLCVLLVFFIVFLVFLGLLVLFCGVDLFHGLV